MCVLWCELSSRELVIDHLIPLSLLGADEPRELGCDVEEAQRDEVGPFLARRPQVLPAGKGPAAVRRALHPGRVLASHQRETALFEACRLTNKD